MKAGVSNRHVLWNVPQCEWRTVVPNKPSHPNIMTVRHSALPWPLTFRPGGETGAVPSHANIASIWVPLPLTVYYELEPFMSRQLCVTTLGWRQCRQRRCQAEWADQGRNVRKSAFWQITPDTVDVCWSHFAESCGFVMRTYLSCIERDTATDKEDLAR